MFPWRWLFDHRRCGGDIETIYIYKDGWYRRRNPAEISAPIALPLPRNRCGCWCLCILSSIAESSAIRVALSRTVGGCRPKRSSSTTFRAESRRFSLYETVKRAVRATQPLCWCRRSSFITSLQLSAPTTLAAFRQMPLPLPSEHEWKCNLRLSLSLLLYCTCLLWYGKRCKAKYYASPSLSSNTWLAPWQFWTNSIILIHICAELSSAGVGRRARALHVCATMEYVWNSSLVSLNLIVFATAAAYSYASRQWVPATTKLFKWQLYARSKKLTPRRASRPPFSERKQKALQSYYSHPPSHYRMHLTVRRDKCGHGQRRPAPRRYTAPARLYWHFSGSSYL